MSPTLKGGPKPVPPDPYDGIPTYEPDPDFVDDDTQPLPNPFEDDPE